MNPPEAATARRPSPPGEPGKPETTSHLDARRRLRQLLPSPLLSTMLFLAWLMLNESASPGHLLLAAVLALVLPWSTRRWRSEQPRIRRGRTALRLLGHVLADIVVSNVEVARRVLGPEAALRPVFVWVPLTIRDPHGLVALAGIVTLTPGTLSSEITADRRHLLVHALHCPDDAAAAALVASIQSRYELPLMEIFE